MSKLGGWKVQVSTSGAPQKIASAMNDIKLLGATYSSLAYLGSQPANGTNHAVLALQTLTTGVDTKNIVVLVFNEKPEGVTLAYIVPVVESGGAFGGTKVEPSVNIPAEAQEALDAAKAGFVGSNIKPFLFVGTKITKGTEYKFIAEVTPVVPNAEAQVFVVTANSMTKNLSFENVLG